jgi:hypothetical protein
MDPEPIKRHLLEKFSYLGGPPILCFWVEEVREVDWAKPNLREIVVAKLIL